MLVFLRTVEIPRSLNNLLWDTCLRVEKHAKVTSHDQSLKDIRVTNWELFACQVFVVNFFHSEISPKLVDNNLNK